MQDSSWLDNKWQEKDRLLSHFSRHQSFPMDSRGYCRHRVFETRFHSLETSVVSLVRLLLLPCAVPFLLLLSIPMFWTLLWIWFAHGAFRLLFPEDGASTSGRSSSSQQGSVDEASENVGGQSQTPVNSSNPGTPYLPATPFASPSISTWFSTNRDDGHST